MLCIACEMRHIIAERSQVGGEVGELISERDTH